MALSRWTNLLWNQPKRLLKSNSYAYSTSRSKDQDYTFPDAKFIDPFKQLHINIPFANALAKMPSFVKFLKDILTRKRKIRGELEMLTKPCSRCLSKDYLKNANIRGFLLLHVL